MKNRAVTLLLCLMLAALSILRAFPASAEGITPATAADFDLPCAAAILIDEDSLVLIQNEVIDGASLKINEYSDIALESLETEDT